MKWTTMQHDAHAALITWAIITCITCTLMVVEPISAAQVVLACICLLGFAACLLCTASMPDVRPRDYIFVSCELLFVYTLFFLVPYEHTAVLLVIITAQTAWFARINIAVTLSFFWQIPFWLTQHYYWAKPNSLILAMLFWSFGLFGILMIEMVRKEQEAQAELARKNSVLEATRFLLKEAAGQSERLRIARDVHDVVGHHLTALTMNFQALEHIFKRRKESVPEQVLIARKIASALLRDVRIAVSDIRDQSALNLKVAIEILANKIPSAAIELHYNLNKSIDNIEVAETLLRFVQESISNSLRHGKATAITIQISDHNNTIEAEVSDNGRGEENLVAGNGMKGLKERAVALGGDFHVRSNRKGTTVVMLLRPSELHNTTT